MSRMLWPGARCTTASTNSRRWDMRDSERQGMGLLRVKPQRASPTYLSSRSVTYQSSRSVHVTGRTSEFHRAPSLNAGSDVRCQTSDLRLRAHSRCVHQAARTQSGRPTSLSSVKLMQMKTASSQDDAVLIDSQRLYPPKNPPLPPPAL